MDRLTFPAAALTVAATFALIPAAAVADTAAVTAAPDSEAAAATDAAQSEPAPASADSGATVGSVSVEPAAEPAVDPTPADSAASGQPAATATEPTPATGTPAAPATEAAVTPDPVSATPVGSAVTVVEEGETSFVVVHSESHAASSDAAPRHPTTSPAAPGAVAVTPLSSADVIKAPLESVLPRVKRELREVEAQINDLRRRVDNGEPAPTLSIIRLSLTLAELAPAIMALDGRLDAAGLTPGLEREVRRLRAQLAGTQASAAGLLVDLRHSEAYGFELGMLMRELESFSALELGFEAPPAALAPARAPSAVELPAAPAQAAPTLSRSVADAPPPTRVAGDGPAVRSPDLVGSDEPPARSLGSGSASPGGAFSAAGVAALAALLIGLAISRLSATLAVAPRRRYSVMFLSPLERPG